MTFMTKDNLRTFKDLYELLRSFNGSDKMVRKLLSLNKKLTWFEIQESLLRLFAKLECKSGFVLDIIDRFLQVGLSYREIVEERLYFADINPLNIFITKLLIDPENKYNLNYFLGDTLQMKFDVKFDAVIGNPPYNSSGTIGSGNTIWQHFVRKSIQEWTVDGGYVLMIHPSGWRKPEYSTSKSKTDGMFKLMTSDNTMLNLVIRGLADGKKAFGCGTRYDYYLIQRTPNTGVLTKVDDEFYKVGKVDMREWNFATRCQWRFLYQSRFLFC